MSWARAGSILWVNFAVMPAELVFDAEAELSDRVSSYERADCNRSLFGRGIFDRMFLCPDRFSLILCDVLCSLSLPAHRVDRQQRLIDANTAKHARLFNACGADHSIGRRLSWHEAPSLCAEHHRRLR